MHYYSEHSKWHSVHCIDLSKIDLYLVNIVLYLKKYQQSQHLIMFSQKVILFTWIFYQMKFHLSIKFT